MTYLWRIFLFAMLSQVSYVLAYRQLFPHFWELNIFFTLFLGLGTILLFQKFKNKLLWPFFILLSAGGALLFNTNYQIIGVLSIVAFYFSFGQFEKMLLSQGFIFLIVYPILTFVFSYPHTILNPLTFIQPAALFSLLFIAKYSGKEGRKTKYLFYFFYPLHFLVISLLLSFFK